MTQWKIETSLTHSQLDTKKWFLACFYSTIKSNLSYEVDLIIYWHRFVGFAFLWHKFFSMAHTSKAEQSAVGGASRWVYELHLSRALASDHGDHILDSGLIECHLKWNTASNYYPQIPTPPNHLLMCILLNPSCFVHPLRIKRNETLSVIHLSWGTLTPIKLNV